MTGDPAAGAGGGAEISREVIKPGERRRLMTGMKCLYPYFASAAPVRRQMRQSGSTAAPSDW